MFFKLTEDKKVVACETHKNSMQRIGLEEFDNVKISTMFLAIDMGWSSPQYFETMIFGGEHDQYQKRYATYEEAVIGHQEAIDLVLGVID